jgi:hypothetical protein
MNYDREQGNFWLFIFIFLVIIGNVLYIRSVILKSELTVYRVLCRGKLVFDKCDTPHVLGKITFKVDPRKQEVIKSIPGSSTKKLTQCIIEDRKNWSCKDEEEKTEFGFRNGNFWKKSSGPLSFENIMNVYYVSKIQYLKIRCRNNLLCVLERLYWDFY